ncbi:hypothetical protein [Clostridium baratii]
MEEILDINFATYLIEIIKNLFSGAIGILFLVVLTELAIILYSRIKKEW